MMRKDPFRAQVDLLQLKSFKSPFDKCQGPFLLVTDLRKLLNKNVNSLETCIYNNNYIYATILSKITEKKSA